MKSDSLRAKTKTHLNDTSSKIYAIKSLIYFCVISFHPNVFPYSCQENFRILYLLEAISSLDYI